MLGSIIRPRPWIWAAIGKHPTAKDYIRLGETSALIDAVGDWAAKGYQQLSSKKDKSVDFYSWRFWLKGVKKGELICGLGRDSSDRIGRPFPFMLIGQGTIKGWEQKWTDLPLILGKTWQAMESTAARRFSQVEDMETALAEFGSPEDVAAENVPDDRQDEEQEPVSTSCREEFVQDGIGLLRMNSSEDEDPERLVRRCHRQLGQLCRQIPRGVFIGGTPQSTCLAAIEHPLGKADFIRLWSL